MNDFQPRTVVGDLGWHVARLRLEKRFSGELHIIAASVVEENIYQPSESVRLYGENIGKLRDFLNEFYPKEEL